MKQKSFPRTNGSGKVKLSRTMLSLMPPIYSIIWAKAKGLRFAILDHAPAMTSARKLQWYTGAQIIGWVALMLLLPVAVRSRKLCGFWYKRPENASS